MSIKDWFLGTGKSKNDTNGVWGHSHSKQYGDDYVHPTQTYAVISGASAEALPSSKVTPTNASKPVNEDKSKDTEVASKQTPIELDFDDVKFPPISADIKPACEIVAGHKPSSKPVAGTPAYSGSPRPATPTYKAPTPTIPQKEVIAFIVESSADVLKYKKEVVAILNNIVASKKTALFLFVKIGDDGKFYELMDYSDVTCKNLVASFLAPDASPEKTSLAEAMLHVKSVFKKQLSRNFTFKQLQYNVSTYSVICIGSSVAVQDSLSKKVITSCIDDFKELQKLKGIKYFCIKDSDTSYAASLGFPTIGHIISNFYE